MALSFEQQIKRIIDNREGVTREIFAASAIQVAEKVITRTPVDTGRARMNWNASINAPDDSTRDESPDAGSNIRAPAASAGSRESLGRTTSTTTRLQLGDTFHLTNGLPYIRALEYGASDQAPNGMVRRSVDEFNAALREVIRRVS